MFEAYYPEYQVPVDSQDGMGVEKGALVPELDLNLGEEDSEEVEKRAKIKEDFLKRLKEG